MGRGPCDWKQTKVKRAVKAITAAGQPVKEVRFDKYGFTVIIGEPVKRKESENATTNEWDEIDGAA